MTAPAAERRPARAIEWNASGITRAQADGRYVKRFVGSTLTAETREQENSVGAFEPVLSASGIISGIPSDVSPSLVAVNFPTRLGESLELVNAGAAAQMTFIRAGGTFQAPSQLLSGLSPLSITAAGWDPTGLPGIAQVIVTARENITPTARGARWRFLAGDVGSSSVKDLLEFRGGGVSIAELVSGQATFRIVPITRTQLRDPSNTATRIEVDATGLGFFGTAPIVKPTVTGAKGGNAALTSLLTQLAALGLITDSTT